MKNTDLISQAPVNRIVLLGASNLTLSMRTVIQSLQHYCGGPSEILMAAGHGRSYGQHSRVLGRELPGIVQSGLWRQLETCEPLPVYALITDVGNDILYGFSPEQILHWISWCIDRLRAKNARIVMTNLPITAIHALPKWRFYLLRNIMFSSCKLSHNEVLQRVNIVHQGLNALAASCQAELFEPEREWMSFDSIHYVFWKRQRFYQQFFSQCAQSGGFGLDTRQSTLHNDAPSSDFSTASWQQRPQFSVYRLFGKTHRIVQPSGYFTDKTTVALY